MSFSIAPIGRLRTGARVSGLQPTLFAGSTVTWFGEFRHPTTGALTAASGVEFLFRAPDGTEVVVPGTLISIGVYGASVAPDDAGLWAVRLYASGAQVDERTFAIEASAFDPDAEDAVVLVDDDGDFILLDDGLVMEG